MPDAWVGLYAESGVWKWSEGENATEISWDINQPEKADGCVFLRQGRKKLHNIECTAEYAFFCMNVSEFVLVHQKETWEGALDYCRTHYNDLAETEYVWTGLRHLAGDWLWVTGDDLNYTAWYQNEQPQCPARELHCGALDKQTKLWTHRDCEEKLSFFCQYGTSDPCDPVSPSC
uniref:C-type lectin domain-containing protein n=1 Tax=Cyprinus carpio TaxID=7962 RepID=A0A8C1ZL47_CYPCA